MNEKPSLVSDRSDRRLLERGAISRVLKASQLIRQRVANVVEVSLLDRLETIDREESDATQHSFVLQGNQALLQGLEDLRVQVRLSHVKAAGHRKTRDF